MAGLDQGERGAEEHGLRPGRDEHVVGGRAHPPADERVGNGAAELRNPGCHGVARVAVPQGSDARFDDVGGSGHTGLADFKMQHPMPSRF